MAASFEDIDHPWKQPLPFPSPLSQSCWWGWPTGRASQRCNFRLRQHQGRWGIPRAWDVLLIKGIKWSFPASVAIVCLHEVCCWRWGVLSQLFSFNPFTQLLLEFFGCLSTQTETCMTQENILVPKFSYPLRIRVWFCYQRKTDNIEKDRVRKTFRQIFSPSTGHL